MSAEAVDSWDVLEATVTQGPSAPTPPHLKGLIALLGQGSQGVPKITDALTAGVHPGGVVIIQLAAVHKERRVSGLAQEGFL